MPDLCNILSMFAAAVCLESTRSHIPWVAIIGTRNSQQELSVYLNIVA